jgi:hypothetical protein
VTATRALAVSTAALNSAKVVAATSAMFEVDVPL